MNLLYFSKVKFILIAEEPMILPEVKTSMFRGGFGHVFKSFNCANKISKECGTCLLKETCIYFNIFSGDSLAQKPKSYVIYSSDVTKRAFEKGEEISFDLILFGRASKYLPHFIFSFIELGKKGITKNCYKYSIKRVIDNEGKILFEKGNVISLASSISYPIPPILKSIKVPSIVDLNFITPLRLTFFGDLVVKPNFEMIIKAITRRITALCEGYCDFHPVIDYRDLISKAKDIKIFSNQLVWKDWGRYSNRQHAKMEFGGLIGKISFVGDMTPFLPFLQIGSHIHIGKNCVFGNGKYILEERL